LRAERHQRDADAAAYGAEHSSLNRLKSAMRRFWVLDRSLPRVPGCPHNLKGQGCSLQGIHVRAVAKQRTDVRAAKLRAITKLRVITAERKSETGRATASMATDNDGYQARNWLLCSAASAGSSLTTAAEGNFRVPTIHSLSFRPVAFAPVFS
jgi:hypothetical protein